MLGAGAVKPKDTAEERAKNVFLRFVDNLIMIMIDRVVHSYWSRYLKILKNSDCSNLIIPAPRSMLEQHISSQACKMCDNYRNLGLDLRGFEISPKTPLIIIALFFFLL